MQNTTTHTIDGLGLQGFSPDELTAVLHYLNDIAGIPDAFDGIEESGWDIGAGLRQELALCEIFQMYARARQDIEKWIEAAHHLRYSAVDALDITKPFELYADFELHKAAEALRCLAGHALDEITGRRED